MNLNDFIFLFDIPLWLRAISFILSLVFVGVIFYFHSKMAELGHLAGLQSPESAEEEKQPGATHDSVAARWQEIKNHITSGNEAEWKFAIIEADKLVDSILREAGYQGDGLGERLINIGPGRLATLQGLWDAHKIRNQIAHDVDYFIRDVEARRAVELYEATLRELGAL